MRGGDVYTDEDGLSTFGPDRGGGKLLAEKTFIQKEFHPKKRRKKCLARI